MSNRSYCNRALRQRATNCKILLFAVGFAAVYLISSPRALAGGDAPQWMHALAGVSLPAYDEKTSAVLLYSETNVTVVSAEKVTTQVREAYKIIRPEGRSRGTVFVYFNPERKIKSLHGWCIPAQGKDFEVKDKDTTEVSHSRPGAELITDVKSKVLRIPAPEPGNIIGYEYEVEERPFFMQDMWSFQETDPVRESRYSLLLPSGWEYKASWLNHAEIKPSQNGNWSQWVVTDVKGIRKEEAMPPRDGVAGAMVVSFFPAGGPALNGFADWKGMGRWYENLVGERIQASPAIKQEVATLTGQKNSQLEKMRALAGFAQHDIRYVGIELGIGGWQPHPAADVLSNRYGDCKDKATLLRSMLREIGVDSYHVVINDVRGAVTLRTPAHNGFNHAILAIQLPPGIDDPSLVATIQHPKLGRILFFDPTNDLIPFGQIPGYLQANYGLLVSPDGGELVELPQQPTSMNSIERVARLTLDPSGNLKGEVKETRLGMRAAIERYRLRTVNRDTDRIKPIEELLSGSLGSFRITSASLVNFQQTDKPFGFNYAFESENYAKIAGNLLFVRPRLIGEKGSALLETKEPRRFAIELDEPTRDTDSFEFTLPAGYVVDDLPPPVDADYSFASYHSKITVKGNVVAYTRTFEVKELSVPVEQADDLRRFYRTIAGDERNTMVLKPVP